MPLPSTTVADECSDNLRIWSDKWTDHRIGWHLDVVHPALVDHGAALWPHQPPGTPARVLIPLCGKTRDMAYMAQQTQVEHVVGVDGIEQALLEFAQEHPHLNVQKQSKQGAFDLYSGEKLTLLKGDFFDLASHHIMGDIGQCISVSWYQS